MRPVAPRAARANDRALERLARHDWRWHVRRPVVRAAVVIAVITVIGAIIFAQVSFAAAKNEPEPRIRGNGQIFVSASSTEYQYSLDLRLKSSGKPKGSFSIKEVGVPNTERFTLLNITTLDLL